MLDIWCMMLGVNSIIDTNENQTCVNNAWRLTHDAWCKWAQTKGWPYIHLVHSNIKLYSYCVIFLWCFVWLEVNSSAEINKNPIVCDVEPNCLWRCIHNRKMAHCERTATVAICGFIFVDINYCLLNDEGCPDHADCMHLGPGDWQCQCEVPYVLKNGQCIKFPPLPDSLLPLPDVVPEGPASDVKAQLLNQK